MSAVSYASTNVPKIFALEAQLVQDFPAACKELVMKLLSQPLFSGYGSPKQKCKILPLSSQTDTMICEILNKNLRKKQPNTLHCELMAYGTGHHTLYEEDTVRPLEHGITVWLSDDYQPNDSLKFQDTVSPFHELEHNYRTILLQMTEGWVPVDPKEHTRIVQKENPQFFDLFIKERRLKAEVRLICLIAEKFGLTGKITCGNQWLDSCMHVQEEKLYLWIERTSVERVAKKFGFSFIETQKPLEKK